MNNFMKGAVMALITASVAACVVPRSDFSVQPIPLQTDEQRELIATLSASVDKLDTSVNELIQSSEWLVKN